MDENLRNSSAVEAKELCDLAEGYSFILQTVLGVLAFSTLIGELPAIVVSEHCWPVLMTGTTCCSEEI